jgi:hypothetical protein
MYSNALTPHAVKIMVNDAVKAGVLKKVKADKVDLAMDCSYRRGRVVEHQ